VYGTCASGACVVTSCAAVCVSVCLLREQRKEDGCYLETPDGVVEAEGSKVCW
jgi:hypothetical protein